MTVVVLLWIFPLYIVFPFSLKQEKEIFTKGPLELPSKLYLGNFRDAIHRIEYFRTLANTALITGTAVAALILLSSMASYTIARRGRRKSFYGGIYYYFIAGILVPYQAIFVPMYLVGARLGFVNNFAGVIALYVATFLPFSVFLMTGFMKTVPLEIEEAAVLDGCSVYRRFWSIVFPMLRPAAATLAILLAFQIWNDFLMPLLFLQKEKLKTLTVRMNSLFEQYVWYVNLAFAAIIISSVPIIVFFLLMQKHFVKGIALGSLKG
jgi:raffinose/stachyose/melibiose transport system permease protein